MTSTFDESTVYTQLRDKAEVQLQAGKTPTAGHWSLGVHALRLLHELSCDPDKAEDALKLLHELQVHQVELDLQNEETIANERILDEDLHLYRALYESAPLAYFVVDRESVVIQGSRAATELFGVDHDQLQGQRVDSLLKPQDQPLLLGLLQRVSESGVSDACIAETAEGAEGSRQLQFLASIPLVREKLLLVCSEYGNAD